MFWGLVLKTNKRYSQKVTKPFHVSQAVLDLGTLSEPNAVIQVWANIDDTDHLIANVSKSSSHVILDLTFTEGESVAFYSKGSGTVHLSGYLLPDEDGFDDFGMGGEEEEEDESEEEELDLEAAKKLMKEKKDKKGAKVAAADEEDEDDDDSDDMDLDGLDAELEGEEEEDSDDMDDDDEDDDDEDDDEEDEEDDDEEDDEEEIQEKPAKKAKLDVNAKQNGLTNGKLSKKDTEQKQKQQPQKNQQEQKQKNQNQQNQQQKSGPKKLSGGIIIEDMRVGKGPEAKTGRKVSVYYEGRLKSNNKVFDSTKSGEGFKFHLGRGEVIRGWDVGIVGMKVGSKRRITCPPNVAYGPKGSPPVIPANATLVFDVELRGVN